MTPDHDHDSHDGHDHGIEADADRRWIALALVALRVARRPPTSRYTFGFGRAEILSAQVNGASLLALGALITVEALQRLFDPPDVEGALVIVVGIAGAVVNIAAAWALSRAKRRSLNVEVRAPMCSPICTRRLLRPARARSSC